MEELATLDEAVSFRYEMSCKVGVAQCAPYGLGHGENFLRRHFPTTLTKTIDRIF